VLLYLNLSIECNSKSCKIFPEKWPKAKFPKTKLAFFDGLGAVRLFSFTCFERRSSLIGRKDAGLCGWDLP
jgi:hypothetical protein